VSLSFLLVNIFFIILPFQVFLLHYIYDFLIKVVDRENMLMFSKDKSNYILRLVVYTHLMLSEVSSSLKFECFFIFILKYQNKW
jgi:hypothetical protein